MLFRKKAKNYEINMDMADNALQNILSSCKQSPNVIPLNQIVKRQQLSTRLYERLAIIASVILLLTFLLPVYLLPLSKLTDGLFTPEPVRLTQHYQEDNTLTLMFSGDNILFKEAYMEIDGSEIYYPISFDKKGKTICFPYYEGKEVLFHIPVKGANEVQLLLTPVYE